MSMTIELSLYEALTDIGVKPDAARRVERQIEATITQGHEAARAQAAKSQEIFRAEMLDQLMTKADGLSMKMELKQDISELRQDMSNHRADLLKAMNDQTWKLVTFVVAANGIMLAALKYLG